MARHSYGENAEPTLWIADCANIQSNLNFQGFLLEKGGQHLEFFWISQDIRKHDVHKHYVNLFLMLVVFEVSSLDLVPSCTKGKNLRDR
jgi:hypothetical protein